MTTLSNKYTAYWKMDEASGNRADSSGNGNTLTDNNTVASDTGKIGVAADFEAGNSEYLSITDNAFLSTGDIDFFFTCWVKLESKTSTLQVIAMKGNEGDMTLEWYLGFAGTSGTDRFSFRVSSDGVNTTAVNANSLGSPSAGVWYFIVCWHDATGNTINIKVNNGTTDSVSYSSGSADRASGFYLGRDINATGYLDGLLDECGFGKTLLTAGEMTSLYGNGSGFAWPFAGLAGTSTVTGTATATASVLVNRVFSLDIPRTSFTISNYRS